MGLGSITSYTDSLPRKKRFREGELFHRCPVRILQKSSQRLWAVTLDQASKTRVLATWKKMLAAEVKEASAKLLQVNVESSSSLFLKRTVDCWLLQQNVVF